MTTFFWHEQAGVSFTNLLKMTALFSKETAHLRSREEVICEIVSDFYKVRFSDLLGPSRRAKFCWPRHVAMFFMRERTNRSLCDIGKIFGGRDHSGVMHGIKRVRNGMDLLTPESRAEIREISQKIDKAFKEGGGQ